MRVDFIFFSQQCFYPAHFGYYWEHRHFNQRGMLCLIHNVVKIEILCRIGRELEDCKLQDRITDRKMLPKIQQYYLKTHTFRQTDIIHTYIKKRVNSNNLTTLQPVFKNPQSFVGDNVKNYSLFPIVDLPTPSPEQPLDTSAPIVVHQHRTFSQ